VGRAGQGPHPGARQAEQEAVAASATGALASRAPPTARGGVSTTAFRDRDCRVYCQFVVAFIRSTASVWARAFGTGPGADRSRRAKPSRGGRRQGALRPVVAKLRQHSADAADQVERAASSIVHNLAEGSRRSGRDPKRFYAMAHGSANEILGALDVADAWGWRSTMSTRAHCSIESLACCGASRAAVDPRVRRSRHDRISFPVTGQPREPSGARRGRRSAHGSRPNSVALIPRNRP
jgi:four helix bundle protein